MGGGSRLCVRRGDRRGGHRGCGRTGRSRGQGRWRCARWPACNARVTTLLGLLTTGVGVVVQSFAGRNLQGDLPGAPLLRTGLLLTAATTSVAFAATLGLLSAAWIVAGLALAGLVTHRSTWRPAALGPADPAQPLGGRQRALLVATLLAVVSISKIDLRSPAAAPTNCSRASIPVLGGNVLSVVAVLLTVAGISRSALVPVHRVAPGHDRSAHAGVGAAPRRRGQRRRRPVGATRSGVRVVDGGDAPGFRSGGRHCLVRDDRDAGA